MSAQREFPPFLNSLNGRLLFVHCLLGIIQVLTPLNIYLDAGPYVRIEPKQPRISLLKKREMLKLQECMVLLDLNRTCLSH